MFKRGQVVRSLMTGILVAVTDGKVEDYGTFRGVVIKGDEYFKRGRVSLSWIETAFELVEIKEVRRKNV